MGTRRGVGRGGETKKRRKGKGERWRGKERKGKKEKLEKNKLQMARCSLQLFIK